MYLQSASFVFNGGLLDIIMLLTPSVFAPTSCICNNRSVVVHRSPRNRFILIFSRQRFSVISNSRRSVNLVKVFFLLNFTFIFQFGFGFSYILQSPFRCVSHKSLYVCGRWNAALFRIQLSGRRRMVQTRKVVHSIHNRSLALIRGLNETRVRIVQQQILQV